MNHLIDPNFRNVPSLSSCVRRVGDLVLAVTVTVTVTATTASAQSQEVAPPPKPPVQERGMPAMPVTPASVAELVELIPFELDIPFEHTMRKDRINYTRGHILVLRAPEAFLVPRQVAEPVLLIGGQTAERINTGVGTGLLVVVVPEWTERAEDGSERVGQPADARIWFATPELPERVDAAWIAAEAVKAEAAGVAGQAVRPVGFMPAKPVRAVDRDALGRVLADIVERHAPQESDCIDALRATR